MNVDLFSFFQKPTCRPDLKYGIFKSYIQKNCSRAGLAICVVFAVVLCTLASGLIAEVREARRFISDNPGWLPFPAYSLCHGCVSPGSIRHSVIVYIYIIHQWCMATSCQQRYLPKRPKSTNAALKLTHRPTGRSTEASTTHTDYIPSQYDYNSRVLGRVIGRYRLNIALEICAVAWLNTFPHRCRRSRCCKTWLRLLVFFGSPLLCYLKSSFVFHSQRQRGRSNCSVEEPRLW